MKIPHLAKKIPQHHGEFFVPDLVYYGQCLPPAMGASGGQASGLTPRAVGQRSFIKACCIR
ncbi:hypothetical protein TPY_2238 [Sulfobacillus acidophilus TPY]|nr:hypothetical protein TPY_2238 [Sulfobacillus acidophilus TPY]